MTASHCIAIGAGALCICEADDESCLAVIFYVAAMLVVGRRHNLIFCFPFLELFDVAMSGMIARTKNAAGQLVLALFVFVRPMTFYESCLAVIFYVAAMLLVGRRQNVGSRLQAAANTLGWYWPGLALGGGVVCPAFPVCVSRCNKQGYCMTRLLSLWTLPG